MPENMISEGIVIALDNATAASNIAAGRMVAVNTGASTIYSYDRETAGLSGTGGGFGMRFIGVLDEAVSAGQCPVVVWTEGVFEFVLQSAITTAALIGRPVFGAASGGGALVTTLCGAGHTGTLPVGSVVGVNNNGAAGTYGTSGSTVKVKINPGALRWGGFAAATGTEQGDNYPPTL